MPACRNGHDSSATDYCDVCGVRIDGATAAPVTAAPALAAPPTASGAACPSCGTARSVDEKFCEVCGLDFTTGERPAAPTPQTATAASAPAVKVVAVADRDWFVRDNIDGLAFPDVLPAPREFVVTGDRALIGRRSQSRGIEPEIDLSGVLEDAGISRAHCELRRAPDGTWTVTDLGSTNGTRIDESPDPIAPQIPVPVRNGTRLHIGAWTRLDLMVAEAPTRSR